MSKNLIPLYSWHQKFTFGLLRFITPDMQVETTVGHLIMEDPTIHTVTGTKTTLSTLFMYIK